MRPYIVQNMPGRGQGGKGIVWDIQECCRMQNGPKSRNICVEKSPNIYLKVQFEREGDINMGTGGHEGRVSIMTHLAK